MPRPSLRSSFIVVAVVLVGLHLVSVTLAALPPNRFSAAGQGQTEYLDPYFTQNWRLFALSDAQREIALAPALADPPSLAELGAAPRRGHAAGRHGSVRPP